MGAKLLFISLLLATSSLDEAEKLFLENKPGEALPALEAALYEDPQNEKIYLYLGIVYAQLGDAEQSLQIMRRGLNVAQALKDRLYYNIANLLFKQRDYRLSEEMYSKALEANRQLGEGYLNRAQARMELQDYTNARTDYIQYLRLVPAAPQRPEIEKLIALLEQALAAAELRQQQELEQQQALLNSVLDSLKNASEDTRNLSAGSEEIEEEYEEIDITE
jgi:tetratricopeptide (TPR) repeat protein